MKELQNLNEQQREAAICTEGPLLILAGAGSGKTSTMIHRIAYLIKEKGVNPYNILAVTFTNKAAKEMRERTEKLIGSNFNLWILTFHSTCLRILRSNIDLLGYTKDFTVYDTTDQKTLIKECIKAENLDDKTFKIPYFQKIIGDCKDKGISSKQYIDKQSIGSKEHKVALVYERYEKVLKKNNALDFDDLILKTVQIFEEHDDVLEHYQERFKYIMVDEYQDTNNIQYKFVELLARKYKNICVVGDDDQCIYEWRGADIRNILEFEKDFVNTNVIKLEQNYRSSATILDAAFSVIKNNNGRKFKKLWTEKEAGEKIKYHRANDERAEAYFIAKEIDRLKSQYKSYSEFTVLYRTHAQSRALEDAFTMLEVPYRIYGGLRFYERKEIKDIIAYLRLINNPIDALAIKRAINEPKRGIGAKTIEKLEALADANSVPLFDILINNEVLEGLSTKISKGVKEFTSVIRTYNARQESMSLSELYDGILNDCGIKRELKNEDTLESRSRLENLQEFKSVIFEFEDKNEGGTLGDFLEKIVLITDMDNHDSTEDAVTMMTMHSAKGLEFPVVFIPGMEDGIFPGRRSFSSPEGLEEERRLCYVGMTRAKEKLYLTNAESRMLYGRTESFSESCFIKEIDKKLFENYEEKKDIQEGNISQKKERFSPSEQMKYVRKTQPKVEFNKESISGSDIKDGDKVIHKKFGIGTVVSMDKREGNTSISIVFESAGLKTLIMEFAPLTKVE